ncbi:MAG: HypC/HybG/HupF family hydrogenase formation chaperone [Bacillota bacterium]|nr:HypC/HybG/HupF family hydrogenase formation chaperone [Bacillota bacterium]
MCLGVPLRIESLEDNNEALAEMNGVKKRIRIDLVPNVKCGEYVMVHAGFALEIIKENAARETLDALEELRTIVSHEQQDS